MHLTALKKKTYFNLFKFVSLSVYPVFMKITLCKYIFIFRITFEFPATGGVIPFARFRTVKLLKYVTASDYFIMACEFIFCAFICYYYVEEALEIKKHKFSYFFSIWNNLDIIVLLVNLISLYICYLS